MGEAVAASVDGVLSRWGIMLLADPEAALRETRRVLRPGGRLALAVWDRAEANPWSMGRLMADLLGTVPEPGQPGPFALGDPERVREIIGNVHSESHLFRLDLREVSTVGLDDARTQLVIDVWTPERGVRTIKRK